jgi:hypothetical protein
MQDELNPGQGQPGPESTQIGLVLVRNNDQIEEAARREQSELETELKEPQIDALASHVLQCWNEASTNKEQNIEPVLMDSWRRRKGEYEPGKLAKIVESGQSPIWMRLTELKCNAFEAWFNDIMTAETERLWTLDPTPVPDLPEQMREMIVRKVLSVTMQRVAGGEEVSVDEIYAMAQQMREQTSREIAEETKNRASRMSDVIEDTLDEGNWESSQDDALEHLSTFGTAIVKGPVVRERQRLRWMGSQAVVTGQYVTEFEAVHPLNLYPAPGARNPDEGYIIEFLEVPKSEIEALRTHPGYRADEIDLLLSEQGEGGTRKFRDLDLSRLRLEDSSESYHLQKTHLMQGIEYHGPVGGATLTSWGMTGITDENAQYEVECVMFGNHVIRAAINANPLGSRRYSVAKFKPRSGSFWGQSIAEMMSDVQDVCNGAARALISNMGIASGPMVVIDDIARIPAGLDLTSLHPWMVMQFNGDRTTNKKPVEFYSPDSHAAELIGIYNQFSREADDRTGIPAYSYGNDQVAGAGKTASGLSMLMNSAARGIKKAITDWDRGIVKGCIERLYVHLMLYHPDESIKGDAQVNIKGALGIFEKERHESGLQQILAETANPVDLGIIGELGRASLLRKRLEMVNKGLSDIVPSNDELLAVMQTRAQAQQQQVQQQAQMEANQTQIEAEAKAVSAAG